MRLRKTRVHDCGEEVEHDYSYQETSGKSRTVVSALRRIMTKCFADTDSATEIKAEDNSNHIVIVKSRGTKQDVKRKVQKWLDENCDLVKPSEDQNLPSRMLQDYVHALDIETRANEFNGRTTSWITMHRKHFNKDLCVGLWHGMGNK